MLTKTLSSEEAHILRDETTFSLPLLLLSGVICLARMLPKLCRQVTFAAPDLPLAGSHPHFLAVSLIGSY